MGRNRKKMFRWAAKVPQHKIRRLYELDARQIKDDDLLDDVAFSLYARCQSILNVTRAYMEKVLTCPACAEDIVLKDHHFSCSCGFYVSYEQFRRSYKGKQLFGANARPVFEFFSDTLPKSRTYEEKMIAVDTLIHSFHILHSARNGYLNIDADDPENRLGRPVAANLIEGKLSEVILFLDQLSSEKSHDCWREIAARANGSDILR